MTRLTNAAATSTWASKQVFIPWPQGGNSGKLD